MIPLYPFRRGDRIRVSVRASTTAKCILFARVRYNDGTPDVFEIDIEHSSGDRSNELKRLDDIFLKDGYFEALTVDTTIEKRGLFYAMIATELEPHHYPVFSGYISIPHTPLGFFEHLLSGRGYEFIDTIIQDEDGDTSTVYTPTTTNARRLVHGIVIYYTCSGGAANRTPRLRYNPLWGALPTGHGGGTAQDVWDGAGPLLSANQDGAYFEAYGKLHFGSENDAGVVTTHDTPEINPFPVLVTEEMTNLDFTIDINAGLAADKYSAYALVEEWISP